MAKVSRHQSLDEEIYMICFSQPRYPAEIQEILVKNGRTTQQSQLLIDHPGSTITKLIKKGWLEKISQVEKQKIIEKIDDGRAKRRQYLQSTLMPLIEHFKKRTPLAKNEARQLKHLFEKKSFRPIFSWENGIRSFDKVQEFLVQLTLWLYIATKYTDPYKMTKSEIKRVGEKKLRSKLIKDIIEKRNAIADRVAPGLKIELTPEKQDQFYSFLEDVSDKLKPPLFDKIMKLYNNNQNTFEIAMTMLACGEFMAEVQQKSRK